MLQGVTKNRRTVTTLTVDAVITVAVEKRVVVRTGTTVGRHYWRRRLSILLTWYWCLWTGSRWTSRMPHSRPRWCHCLPEVTLPSGAWCNRHPTCWPRTCALKSAWSNSMPPPLTVPRQLWCAAWTWNHAGNHICCSCPGLPTNRRRRHPNLWRMAPVVIVTTMTFWTGYPKTWTICWTGRTSSTQTWSSPMAMVTLIATTNRKPKTLPSPETQDSSALEKL